MSRHIHANNTSNNRGFISKSHASPVSTGTTMKQLINNNNNDNTTGTTHNDSLITDYIY